ncbi:MAG: hypothetical protein LBT56_04140 [Prevotellaceae bacterium]|jgi:hypothetical protein|nr:hypothetical protein [Prevotellaceae bacterium]
MEEQNFIFDNDLYEALESILENNDNFSDCIVDIVTLMFDKKINRKTLSELMNKYGIKDIEFIKDELLNLLIAYIKSILKDGVITENEQRNIKMLKRYFRVEEGDLYSKKYKEIKIILTEQLEKLYADNKISIDEAVYCVYLQDLFDLNYEQMDEFKKDEVITSLILGAKITDLDTSLFKKQY